MYDDKCNDIPVDAALFPHTRGDTFDYDFSLVYSNGNDALQDVLIEECTTVRAELRTIYDDLICELVGTVIDPSTVNLRDSLNNSNLWPIGIQICDIQLTDVAGNVESTQKFNIEITGDVTHD